MPVRGLGCRVTGPASDALVSRTVRGLVDDSTLAVTSHAPLLPVCSLGGSSNSLRIAAGAISFARGLDDCACIRLAVARPAVTGRGHAGPATGHVATTGHVTARPFLLTISGLGEGVGGLGGVTGIAQRLLLPPGIAATLGRRWSLPLRLPVAPFLASHPLYLTLPGCSSLSRSMAQRDAAAGSLFSAAGSLFSAAGVTVAWVLPGPAAPVTSAAPVACSSASVPAPGVVTPASAASATASPGRCQLAWESTCPERRCRRSSGGKKSHSGGKHGRGQSPSLARSAHFSTCICLLFF